MSFQLTTAKIWNGSAWEDASTGTVRAEYLIVGAGGGGGSLQGGGGGAGAFSSGITDLPSTFGITIGAGGTTVNNVTGNSGGFTQLGALQSHGGGGGAGYNSRTGAAGASGGGASAVFEGFRAGGATTSLAPLVGNKGGDSNGRGAGGGGAGNAGAASNGNSGANGGNGLTTNIISTSLATTHAIGEVSGSDLYFAGGGASSYSNAGVGGLGGGGDAGNSWSGKANTGGGGGNGANGGSGVVVLKMLGSETLSVGAGLTYSTAVENGFTIYTFKSGSGLCTVVS